MLTPVDELRGDDAEDTRLLQEMAAEARRYISDFDWCPPVATLSFAGGVGGVVALFLVEFETAIAGTDRRLWLVAGDLPTAYFVVNEHDSAHEALATYCGLMDDWIAEVRAPGSIGEVYPVAAARTAENAELLAKRLAFLRERIIPFLSTDGISDEPPPRA